MVKKYFEFSLYSKGFTPVLRKAVLSVLLVSIISITSCGRKDLLESKIAELKIEQTVDGEQFTALVDLIEKNSGDRSFKKFLSKEGVFQEEKLITFLEKKGYTVSLEAVKGISKINFYLESSGSIDGYLNGNTSYKNDIIDLLVDVKNHYDVKDINLSYITNQVTPLNITDNVNDITKALTIDSFRTAGNRASSDLNGILNTSFNLQDDGEVTFLVSDMIYSIEGSNVLELLNASKSFIKDAFNKALKKDTDLSTLILKLDSDFTGTYYSYNNLKTTLNKENRPYYIFVFGGERYLNEIIAKLDLLNRKEVKEYHYFTPSTLPIYYNVFKTESDNGSYKVDKGRNNEVVSISDIRLSGRDGGEFSFTVGVDYSKLNLESKYLEDVNNYAITHGNYELVGIEKFDVSLLHPSAKEQLSRSGQTLTHLLTFEAKNKSYNDLSFELKKKVPSWVLDVNTENDLKIQETINKTFGFKYLFDGIYESYLNNTSMKNYSEFKIKISK